MRNNELLEHSVNKKFEEILHMTEDEFRSWVREMRAVVVDLWDNKGLPPRVGLNDDEIVEQFNQLESYPVHEMLTEDLLTGKKNVIRNTSILGNACNEWFPTMMKTKISYGSNASESLSIYDHFKEESLYEKMVTYGRRHFKRDSFYAYSNPVKVKDDPKKTLFITESGVEWIKKFESNRENLEKDCDYWIEAKEENAEYTGYDDKLRNSKYLNITKDELDSLPIPDKCKTNISYRPESNVFQIRFYKTGQRIFPIGLKAFRISVCQYAVNFPPLAAKFVYEKFTEKIKDQEQILIWDPSSGWGGRILGAMSVRRDRNIHYIGTDPNTDHSLPDGRTKYHEVADTYNFKSTRTNSLFPQHNTYEIYQCGSEMMKDQEGFQKYKGKLDIVFTSPPYFAKEVYSEDKEQSCHKFPEYSSWVDGFLKPTLETAVEWLKPGGVIIWNIANAKFGKDVLPLEDDSIKILKDLGMNQEETLYLALAQMPGGNRVDPDTGLPLARNFCKINDAKKGIKSRKEIWMKYEPMFVFRK